MLDDVFVLEMMRRGNWHYCLLPGGRLSLPVVVVAGLRSQHVILQRDGGEHNDMQLVRREGGASAAVQQSRAVGQACMHEGGASGRSSEQLHYVKKF